jgi:hypothetical protein
MNKKYFSLREATESLGVTRPTLWKYMKRMEITAKEGGADWRERFITGEELEQIRAVINDRSLLIDGKFRELPA